MNTDENVDRELSVRNTQKQINPRDSSTISSLNGFKEVEDFPKESTKKSCTFPTAYSVLLIIELVVFILTYIIPKGLYDKISYSSDDKMFIVKTHDGNVTRYEPTKEVLDRLKVKIPLDSFLNGYIIDPISIPDTYHEIEEKMTNPLNVILYPVLGCMDSAYITFFLMVMGGNLNLLIEMDALSSGMAALGRVTRGKEFLLLILVFVLIAIGGTTYGMMEETLAFYPILMPIFLKSGFDGVLSAAPLFMGALIGNMFSTVNTFCVVLASYSAGISFVNGIVYRIILFVFGNVFSILYLYVYYKKIQADETSSAVYDIKEDIENHFLKREKKKKIKQENKDINQENNIKDKNNDKNTIEINEQLIPQKKDKFILRQKIALILFIIAFVTMIAGILIFNWWFEHMTSTFVILGIILMFLYKHNEKEAIECFLRGAGDFIGVSLVIGIARGINLTLNDGKISDTILNSLSKVVEDLPELAFAIILFIIFIFLGIFIQSSSGLAILSMPVFSPLVDKVGLPKATLVNAYMFGEYLAAFFTPTGMVLIALSEAKIDYSCWIKFIWPFLLILFVLLLFFVMISAYVD